MDNTTQTPNTTIPEPGSDQWIDRMSIPEAPSRSRRKLFWDYEWWYWDLVSEIVRDWLSIDKPVHSDSSFSQENIFARVAFQLSHKRNLWHRYMPPSCMNTIDLIEFTLAMYAEGSLPRTTLRKRWCEIPVCDRERKIVLHPSKFPSPRRFQYSTKARYTETGLSGRIRVRLDRMFSLDPDGHAFSVQDIRSVWDEYVEALRRDASV